MSQEAAEITRATLFESWPVACLDFLPTGFASAAVDLLS